LKKNFINKIGVLGGTFDPAHMGHLKISIEAKKRYKLKKIIWAITKKNPFKNKSYLNLKKRIKLAKKISSKNKFIKVRFFENKIKSSKTADLIDHLKKNRKSTEIYFIMGADNLVNFHKWHRWNEIASRSILLVFNRGKYKTKSLKSITYKKYNNLRLKFINFKKINISSSKLRNI
jgi:nicotinate-nucleotide adenylyltransferase